MQKNKPTPQRDPERDLEDIRDDCISIFLNSGMTQQQVHENGGPTPKTISKWLYKETRFPQFVTIRSMLKACGGDLMVMSDRAAEELRTHTPTAERLGLPAHAPEVMPARRVVKKYIERRDARKAARGKR